MALTLASDGGEFQPTLVEYLSSLLGDWKSALELAISLKLRVLDGSIKPGDGFSLENLGLTGEQNSTALSYLFAETKAYVKQQAHQMVRPSSLAGYLRTLWGDRDRAKHAAVLLAEWNRVGEQCRPILQNWGLTDDQISTVLTYLSRGKTKATGRLRDDFPSFCLPREKCPHLHIDSFGHCEHCGDMPGYRQGG